MGFRPPGEWGGALSIGFPQKLHDLGLDRLCLTLGTLSGLDGRPDVIRQAEYGDTLFQVLSGSALVRLIRPGGEETILSILRRGEIFGELSVLGERPRSSTVTTNGPAELIESSREVLGRLLKATPTLLKRFDHLYRHRAIAANVAVLSSDLGGAE